MTKTNRINTEMRYINNRQRFTIKNLMDEFEISRSTAIRDLEDIQELGMPLVSQVGPSGGYSVMRNQLLPAVQFNTDELKALFVSFMATTNTQLPFLQNRQTMTEKLLAIASNAQQSDLVRLKQLLRFENTNPANTDLLELTDVADPLLKTLINASLTNRHLSLVTKGGNEVDSYVQYLYNQDASWQVVIFDLDNDLSQSIPLSSLESIGIIDYDVDIESIKERIKKAEPEPNLILKLGSHAVQQFKRLHRPNKTLQYLDPFEQTAIYQDFIALDKQQSVSETVDWLLFLGSDVEKIKMPKEIKNEIVHRLNRWS